MIIKRLITAVALGACLLIPITQAATVDGDPGVNKDNNSGLYVWRDNAGAWQVRFVSANTQSQEFSGTFTSNQEINGITNVSIESPDEVSLTSYNTLTTVFQVWQGGLDGVSFSTASGADLCLSDSTGASRTVYLGANAVAATTPVDLSGTGACSPPGSSATTKEGLNINNVSAGNWEVRLVSVDNPFEFSGTFYTAGSQFDSAQPVSLESSDSLEVSRSTIKTGMSTWPGYHDGINFSLSSGSNLCMWGAGFNGPIYVNGSPASLPLDLSGTDACNGGGDSTDGSITTKTSNPGHYLALMRGNDSQETMGSSIKAGMKGFVKRYTWRELEPTLDNYNFSEIASDLDFVSSQGLKLMIMIEDKSFTNEFPVPDYLQGSQYMRPNRKNGYTAIRWDSYVLTRSKALMTQLGNHFDNNPALEGITPNLETAPSLDDIHLDETGYTPEKYRDNIIDLVTHTGNVFSNSRVFWFFNFLPRNQNYIGQVAEAIRGNPNMVMGNPDVMPDDEPINRLVYPFYYENQGKIDLFGQVEPSCYIHVHEDTSYPTYYWTMPELFDFASNNLKVKYMFWYLWSSEDGYGWLDALPVIEINPIFNQ